MIFSAVYESALGLDMDIIVRALPQTQFNKIMEISLLMVMGRSLKGLCLQLCSITHALGPTSC